MNVTAAPPRHAVRFVLATVLIDTMSFGIVMPVLPELVMQLGHVDLPHAVRIGGWLAIVYAAVQFLTGPLVGNMGDRFGRRPILLCALAGFAIDYLLLSFAPNLAWLFVGRAFAGLFGASFGPAGAALADLSAPEERARYFGLMGAAFGIGFIAGPALGGVLGELGPRAPFYLASGLAAANLALGLLAFPETLPADRRRAFDWRRANPLGAWRALGRLHGVLPLAVANFFWQLAGMIYPVTWAYFAVASFGWSPGVIGATLAYAGVLMALAQALLVGRVVKALGERRAAIVGMGGAVVMFVLYCLATQGWMVIAIMLLTPTQSLVMPSLGAMMSRRVDAGAQGELQGFNASVAAVAAILAPAVYNPAIAWFISPAAPFRLPGAGFALAAVAAVVAMAILAGAARHDQMPSATPS